MDYHIIIIVYLFYLIPNYCIIYFTCFHTSWLVEILYYHLFNLNTHGRNRNIGTILNIRPPMVPTAREYQKGWCPSIRNGIMPNTVERMVRRIGMIL